MWHIDMFFSEGATSEKPCRSSNEVIIFTICEITSDIIIALNSGISTVSLVKITFPASAAVCSRSKQDA